MAALNSLTYLVYSILTLTANNKARTDPSLNAWEVGSETQATETWNQEYYTTRNYDVEKCPPGETWSDCDAGCQTTCETVGKPNICPRMCVPGCVCEQPGEVRGPNKQCIASPLCPKEEEEIIWPDSDVWKTDVDQCAQPAEPGLCNGHFPRFYFDKEAGQCKKFIYGGCGGNENNFKTEEECQSACQKQAERVCKANERYNECATSCPLTCENYKKPPKVCPYKCFIGCECKKGFIRRGDGKCVKPEQCPKTQDAEEHDSDRCAQPAETGLCHGHLPRFYFDKEAGQCKKFIYGGCGGNENNFKTEEECQSACQKQAGNSYVRSQ